MDHPTHEPHTDALERLERRLDRCASTTDAEQAGRLREALGWVRAIRAEVDALLGDADVCAFDAAIGGLALRVGQRSLAIAREMCADAEPQTPLAGASERPAETGPHVAEARSIRADVAAFRERLRAEQAERARLAAEERRRFVERLRGATGTADTPAEGDAAPEPSPGDRHERPAVPEPSAEASEPIERSAQDDGARLEPPAWSGVQHVVGSLLSDNGGSCLRSADDASAAPRRRAGPRPTPIAPAPPALPEETAPVATPAPPAQPATTARFRRIDAAAHETPEAASAALAAPGVDDAPRRSAIGGTDERTPHASIRFRQRRPAPESHSNEKDHG